MATAVWICQCLCPLRHAILAAANEGDEIWAHTTLIEELKTQIGRMIILGQINPWCGICRSPLESWNYEVARTKFRTLEEGLPELDRGAAANAAARLILGRH